MQTLVHKVWEGTKIPLSLLLLVNAHAAGPQPTRCPWTHCPPSPCCLSTWGKRSWQEVCRARWGPPSGPGRIMGLQGGGCPGAESNPQICFAWHMWYLHFTLQLVVNSLKLWNIYLQIQVSMFSGKSGISRTSDRVWWGWLSRRLGSPFLQGPPISRYPGRAAWLITQHPQDLAHTGSLQRPRLQLLSGVCRNWELLPTSEPELLPSAPMLPSGNCSLPISGAVQ